MTNVFRRYRQRRAETKQLKRQAELDFLAERLDAVYLPPQRITVSSEKAHTEKAHTEKKPLPADDEDDPTTDPSLQCKICSKNKNKLVTNCGHLFCAACYNSCIQNDTTCPFCSKSITSRIVLFP